MDTNQLTISLEGVDILVQAHRMGKNTIYRINYPDNRKPLVITKADRPNGKAFWTSIPEGRQKEAEIIGNLIDNHINK